MSFKCVAWVLDNSDSTLGARLVLISLAEFAQDDGSETYPSVETLMKRSRLSRRGVQDALRRLESDGSLARDGLGSKGQTKWRVLMGGADSARGGADNDTGGAQISTPRGAASAPEPLENHQEEPSNSPLNISDLNLSPDAAHVLVRLNEMAKSKKGSKRPEPVRVASLVADFPKHDHRTLIAGFVDYWLHGKGSATKRADLVKTYRNWCERTLPVVSPSSPTRPATSSMDLMAAYERRAAGA